MNFTIGVNLILRCVVGFYERGHAIVSVEAGLLYKKMNAVLAEKWRDHTIVYSGWREWAIPLSNRATTVFSR